MYYLVNTDISYDKNCQEFCALILTCTYTRDDKTATRLISDNSIAWLSDPHEVTRSVYLNLTVLLILVCIVMVIHVTTHQRLITLFDAISIKDELFIWKK